MVISEIGGAGVPHLAPVPGPPGRRAAVAETGRDGPAGAPCCCCPQPEASTMAPRAAATRAGTLRIADSFRCSFSRSALRRRAAGDGSRDCRSPHAADRLFSYMRSETGLPVSVCLIRLYPYLTVNAQLRILTRYYRLVM